MPRYFSFLFHDFSMSIRCLKKKINMDLLLLLVLFGRSSVSPFPGCILQGKTSVYDAT